MTPFEALVAATEAEGKAKQQPAQEAQVDESKNIAAMAVGEKTVGKPEQQKTEEKPEEKPEIVIPEGYIPTSELDVYKSKAEAFEKDFAAFESDPILKELLGLKKKNVAITHDLLSEAYTDYSKFDTQNLSVAKNLLRNELLAKGYSEREADLEMKRQYRELYSADADSESEDYQIQEFAAKRAAKELIEGKKANQVRLKEIQSSATNKEEIIREIRESQQKVADEQQRQLKDNAEKLLEKHKKVTHSFTFDGDGDAKTEISVDVEITKDMKAQLKKDLQNPTLAFAVYQALSQVQKEVTDEDVMRTMMFWRNPNLIMKLVVDTANSKNLKDFVEKKIDHKKQQPASGSPQGVEYSKDPLGVLAKGMAEGTVKTAKAA